MAWKPKLGPAFTKVLQAAQRGPRQLWFLGNEPERAEQSDTSPADFADAMRTWRALVGGPWAGPGILWGDPGRVWLDAYLRLGGPIPDVWAIHIYGSLDIAGWLDQYNHALGWLSSRNLHQPVWVTETNGSGALMRYLAWRDNLVAYWYCAHDPFGDNRAADLHDAQGQLTHLGRVFAGLQGAAAAGSDVRPRAYMPIVRG